MKYEDILGNEKLFKNLSAEEVINKAVELLGIENIALASSLSIEDQLITYFFKKNHPKARIFTLDTGRLHQETYDVMDETRKRYNLSYEICFPEPYDIKTLIEKKGPNSFFKSVENRKECCKLRKLKPLQKKISELRGWITGLRKEQNSTREDLKKIEWDETFSIAKFNPLADWTESDVWECIWYYNIPYNKLYDQSYKSIGCAPCTRNVAEGGDVRSGRWWWETTGNKECGLHIKDGKLMRRKS